MRWWFASFALVGVVNCGKAADTYVSGPGGSAGSAGDGGESTTSGGQGGKGLGGASAGSAGAVTAGRGGSAGSSGSGGRSGSAGAASDSDGDGLADDDETSGASGFVTDPNDPDSDGDTVDDGEDAAPIHAACSAHLHYWDDFTTDPSGRWTVVKGNWLWDPTESTYENTDTADGNTTWLGARSDLSDYVMEVRMRLDAQNGYFNAGPIFRASAVSAVLDGGAHYFAGLFAESATAEQVVFGFMNGTWNQLAATVFALEPNVFYAMRIRAAGSSVRVEVNDTLLVDTTNAQYATGGVGLRTHQSPASYDYVLVCD